MESIKRFWNHPPLGSARLQIRGIGVREKMPPAVIDRPGGTGDFLLMFFQDPVLLEHQGERCRYDAETLMLWPREAAHYYGNPDRKWRHSWVHFKGSFARRILAQNRHLVNSPIAFDRPMWLEETLLRIYEELTEHADPDWVIVENLLETFLRRAGRHVLARPDRQSIAQRLLRVKRYLDANYHRTIRLESLAEMTHCSVPHFCSEFKRSFGCSAISYLVDLRLSHARYLLADRNLQVGEIAQRVGYADCYYFSKHFKKHYGVSPRAMREQMGS